MRLPKTNLICFFVIAFLSSCGGNNSSNASVSSGHSALPSSSSNSSLLRSSSASSKKTTPPDSNHAPVANVEIGVYGMTVFVDASKSTDPDQDDFTTSIDFGDGKTIAYSSAWHTYFTESNYTIEVSVKDSSLTGNFSKTIAAKPITGNHAPVAILNTYNNKASGGVSEDIDGDTLTYTFDFGIETTTGTDSSASVKSITCPTPPVNFREGSGTVTMTVSDGQLSDTVQDYWELLCGNFSIDKGTTSDFIYRVDGLTVYVDGRKSSYSWGFNWNFGDGSPISKGVFSQHTYASAGVYDINLHSDDTTNSFFNHDKTIAVTVGVQSSSASSK